MNENINNTNLSYKDSGVNIDEGNRFVNKIKTLTSNNKKNSNISGIGHFGGMYDISNLDVKNPVLVTSIDGVGTKLIIAKMMNKHDTVGYDIVNHCVNDIIVGGAKPLYFTDYIGCGKLDADVMASVIESIIKACNLSDLELMGGETAEMPGMYSPGDYDLVGSITGVVDKSKIIDGSSIEENNIIIGIPSNGLHTNGYSLARKIAFDVKKLKVTDFIDDLNTTIGEALLLPHTNYYKIIMELLNTIPINGLAHITGGGMTENIPRILPKNLSAEINLKSINILKIFDLLRQWGNIEINEMLRVFNMGIGMVTVVSEQNSTKCLEICKKFHKNSNIIGKIVKNTCNKVSYIS